MHELQAQHELLQLVVTLTENEANQIANSGVFRTHFHFSHSNTPTELTFAWG